MPYFAHFLGTFETRLLDAKSIILLSDFQDHKKRSSAFSRPKEGGFGGDNLRMLGGEWIRFCAPKMGVYALLRARLCWMARDEGCSSGGRHLADVI